jgi:Transposase and inactivated derivatives
MSLLDRQELAKRLANGENITPQSIVDEFKLILKDVIEEASNAEITEYLGYDKHHTSDNTNYRNGYNTKTLKTNYGEILVDIPRDRDGTFNPKLVKKREVVLNGTDDLVISLYAKGMSVRDIKSHLEQLYGFELSEQTISNMAEKILDKAKEWHNRPLDRIYPFVIIDATILKVRIDGNVKNIATYIMLGVKLDGSKEILGMWISKDCEQSVYWLDIFNEIKNRGVDDILIISTDNLSGISKAINSSFPNTQILLLAATSA